jgi:zinc protease
MRVWMLTAGLVCALGATAQERNGPELTAEQIIEKSIEASGGRKTIEAIWSSRTTCIVENTVQGMHIVAQIYAKAPNKRLKVMNIEGFGEVVEGYDGRVGWREIPLQGVAEITGEELSSIKREAMLHAQLRWRDEYRQVRLKGREKVGDRETYAVEMTPVAGARETRYFDTQTFLMLQEDATSITPRGRMRIKLEFSDYRDVGDGVKVPFRTRQVMPMGEVITTVTEVRNNIEIDDSMFAKPALQ